MNEKIKKVIDQYHRKFGCKHKTHVERCGFCQRKAYLIHSLVGVVGQPDNPDKEREERIKRLLVRKEKISHSMHELYAEFNLLGIETDEAIESQKELFIFKENLGVYKPEENESNN
jgi:hypothetical protein